MNNNDYLKKLVSVANLTSDEAKKMLLDEVQKELTGEIAKKIRQAEERIKEDAGQKAKEILVDAMRHGATSYVAEYTVSTVAVPNEDVKGRPELKLRLTKPMKSEFLLLIQ